MTILTASGVAEDKATGILSMVSGNGEQTANSLKQQQNLLPGNGGGITSWPLENKPRGGVLFAAQN